MSFFHSFDGQKLTLDLCLSQASDWLKSQPGMTAEDDFDDSASDFTSDDDFESVVDDVDPFVFFSDSVTGQ